MPNPRCRLLQPSTWLMTTAQHHIKSLSCRPQNNVVADLGPAAFDLVFVDLPPYHLYSLWLRWQPILVNACLCLNTYLTTVRLQTFKPVGTAPTICASTSFHFAARSRGRLDTAAPFGEHIRMSDKSRLLAIWLANHGHSRAFPKMGLC